MASDSRLPFTVKSLIFDLVGTLVDEVGTVRDETRRVFEAGGLGDADTEAFAEDWVGRFREIRSDIVAGNRPFSGDEENRRQALGETLEAGDLRLDEPHLEELARVGRRLRPWPGATEGLAAIAEARTTCSLTNASFGQVAELSYRGGLRWHTILCTELVETFKPDPAAYAMAIDRLALDPSETLFVAAHGWDIGPAGDAGFHTAYLPRPHAEGPEEGTVDLELESLADLVRMLAADD